MMQLPFLVVGWVALLGDASHASAQVEQKPRLVLQITVDQLRGDLPFKYLDRLSEDGFRYFLNEGTVFRNAHHRHAITETIVGHTTLATGADPAAHGMIGNVWLDRATSQLRYNVEDARYPILSEDAGVDQETEIDPTQRTARTDGRSPLAIEVSTFSDELVHAFSGRSKVFAVSIKDRGAISMAGHSGKAFWFSKKSGEFITSSFYFEEYPEWVTRWNARQPAMDFENKAWNLLKDRSTYQFADRDDQEWETELADFGRTFPHSFGDSSDKYFTTLLTISPAGDQLTLDFAMALIENEGIGEDDVPDYLSVSLSSTDYVGHIFGPTSLEMEDQLLRLDRVIEQLLEYIDQKIGLENTLVVLSADHGGPDAPGYLREFGHEVDYVDVDQLKAPLVEALEREFGVGDELIDTFFSPYFYLNRESIVEHGLDQGEIENVMCETLMKHKDVHLAVSRSMIERNEVRHSPVMEAVVHNYHPTRSGDVHVVFKPNRFINDFDGLNVACTHGSPWRYDTYVPIMVAGPGIRHEVVHREVHTIDIASTLSLILGTKPPSGATGEPLVEALKGSNR